MPTPTQRSPQLETVLGRGRHNPEVGIIEIAHSIIALPATKSTADRWLRILVGRNATTVAHDIDGRGWPRELASDDGKRIRHWHCFLIENLVAAKAALVAA